MYFKLAVRNAKRSVFDYLLYIAAVTVLVAVMEVSNCIACVGEMAGFHTASLPILIVGILVILVGYVDSFMLKQRAREFANYLLLGMDKRKLSRVFLCEFLLIGLACFVAGAGIGMGVYALLGAVLWREGEWSVVFFARSALQSFAFFCLAEGVCALYIKRRMDRLQIRELMYERERSQGAGKGDNCGRWGMLFVFCAVCVVGMILGIIFLPEKVAVFLIAFFSVPLLGSIFSFYQWVFELLHKARRERRGWLYGKDCLYMAAQLTSGCRANAVINAVFSVCLLFSAVSFCFGSIVLEPESAFFDDDIWQWMGFLQISISIIFIVIYFSILSLKQVLEIKQEAKSAKILYCIGKSREQLERLKRRQIGLCLSLPMVLPAFLLAVSVPLLNIRLNQLLSDAMQGVLLRAAGCFGVCFLVFYGGYFWIVYKIMLKNLFCLLYNKRN